MAPPLEAIETVELINVSQDYTTPTPQSSASISSAHSSRERILVEDSLPLVAPERDRPRHPPSSLHMPPDELYDVSPLGKALLEEKGLSEGAMQTTPRLRGVDADLTRDRTVSDERGLVLVEDSLEDRGQRLSPSEIHLHKTEEPMQEHAKPPPPSGKLSKPSRAKVDAGRGKAKDVVEKSAFPVASERAKSKTNKSALAALRARKRGNDDETAPTAHIEAASVLVDDATREAKAPDGARTTDISSSNAKTPNNQNRGGTFLPPKGSTLPKLSARKEASVSRKRPGNNKASTGSTLSKSSAQNVTTVLHTRSSNHKTSTSSNTTTKTQCQGQENVNHDRVIKGTLKHPTKPAEDSEKCPISLFDVPESPVKSPVLQSCEPLGSSKIPRTTDTRKTNIGRKRPGRPPKGANKTPNPNRGGLKRSIARKPKQVPGLATADGKAAKISSTKANMMSKQDAKVARNSKKQLELVHSSVLVQKQNIENRAQEPLHDCKNVPIIGAGLEDRSSGDSRVDLPNRTTHVGNFENTTSPADVPDLPIVAKTGLISPFISDRQSQKPTTPLIRKIPRNSENIPTSIVSRTLLNDRSIRKSNIISWDATGPLNQGLLKTNKDIFGSPKSSEDLAHLSVFGDVPRGRLSSSAIKLSNSDLASVKSRIVQASDNIAPNVIDALKGMNRKTAAAASTCQLSEPIVVYSPTPVLIDDPHISGGDNYQADDFLHIDDLGTPPLVETNKSMLPVEAKKSSQSLAMSQVAMPPPAYPKKSVAIPAPVASHQALKASQRLQYSQSSDIDNNITSKERSQAREVKSPTKVQLQRVQNSPAETTSGIVSKVQPGRDDPAKRHSPAARSNKHSLIQPRHITPRRSRHVSSRGTVDLQGSPIPNGMVVDGEKTVLETFSQQSFLPKSFSVEDVVLHPDLLQAAEKGTTSADRSEATGVLQSSRKRRSPSLFELEDASIERNPKKLRKEAVNLAIPHLLTTHREAHHLLPDAISKAENHTSSKNAPKSATFKEKLQQIAQDMKQQRKAGSKPPNPIDSHSNDTEPHSPKRKREPSYSEPSPDSSIASNETTESMRDMLLWREALQPHQLDLFDELVNISHRLIRHVVDKDTATADIVHDFRRRGMTLVEKMREAHSERSSLETKRLSEGKGRLRKVLDLYGDRVADVIENLEAEKREGSSHSLFHEGGDAPFQALLERFC